ncbi:hypothetical protein AAC387_Pa10g2141 [Persea americana]
MNHHLSIRSVVAGSPHSGLHWFGTSLKDSGAFTGVCSKAHVPSYKNNIEKLKANGVDSVICVAVNDPYVMNGWAETLKQKDVFGLSHLVLDLARLCPDVQKHSALINAYNARQQKSGPRENGSSNNASSKESTGSNKGKEEVEVLSKDGYRAGKGKSKMSLVGDESQPSSVNRHSADSSGSDKSLSIGNGGNSKQQRKTSKFLRVRLGDGSASALLDQRHMDASPERTEEPTTDISSDGLPVRGVWRNGGGQRLVARTQRDVSR